MNKAWNWLAGVAVLSTGVVACSGERLSNLGEMNHAGAAGTSSTPAQAGSGGGSVETEPSDRPELHGSAGASSNDSLADACREYCDAYDSICPQAGLGAPAACAADCVDALAPAKGDCIEGKIEAYGCIATAMRAAPSSCSAALANANADCGGADAQVDACHEAVCEESLHGDAQGTCIAEATCDNGNAVLTCVDSRAGNVSCSCSLNGNVEFDIATGFDNEKSACEDEDLWKLCKQLLP